MRKLSKLDRFCLGIGEAIVYLFSIVMILFCGTLLFTFEVWIFINYPIQFVITSIIIFIISFGIYKTFKKDKKRGM